MAGDRNAEDWNEILGVLEETSSHFNTLDVGDLSTLAALLRERETAVASLHLRALSQPRETRLEAALLDRLHRTDIAGRILAARLHLQITTLRDKMAMLQHERRVAQSLVSHTSEDGNRLCCRG